MMNEPDKSTFFLDLQRLVVDYVKTRLELTQLVAFEKISKIVAYLVIGVILALLFFFGLLFASVVLGLFLSDLLGSPLFGFGIIAVLYLLVFMIILALRNNPPPTTTTSPGTPSPAESVVSVESST